MVVIFLYRLNYNELAVYVAVWLSGNTLVSINVVTLRPAWLAPGLGERLRMGKPLPRRTRHQVYSA